jgi:hypothetical protein
MAYCSIISNQNSLRRMEMRQSTTFVIGIVIISSIFIFNAISFAQPPWINASAEEMPKAFMAYEDKNGDGKITPDEYQGPPDHWTFFDKNGDGIIDISEAARPDNLPPGM